MKMLQWNREEALAAHELARSRMADRQKSSFTPFKKGDQVWLDSRNLKTVYHKKMKPKREGPFIITDMLGPVTYQLKLPGFTTSFMQPYCAHTEKTIHTEPIS